MVGGTTPPQSDSGEISRVLVLNLLWQRKRCSRTAQDISVLTTPSLLSRGSLCVIDEIKKGGPGHSRQAKRVQRAACGDGHVFSPIDGEGHRRCVDCAPHLEMPKRLAGGRIERDEISFGIAGKQQSSRVRKHASVSG